MARLSKEQIAQNKAQLECINDAIRNKEWQKVWKEVVNIGYANEPDATKRYLIFLKTVKKFDPDRNNNFIHFYKNAVYYAWLNSIDNQYDGDVDMWPDYTGDQVFKRESTKSAWHNNLEIQNN